MHPSSLLNTLKTRIIFEHNFHNHILKIFLYATHCSYSKKNLRKSETNLFCTRLSQAAPWSHCLEKYIASQQLVFSVMIWMVARDIFTLSEPYVRNYFYLLFFFDFHQNKLARRPEKCKCLCYWYVQSYETHKVKNIPVLLIIILLKY